MAPMFIASVPTYVGVYMIRNDKKAFGWFTPSKKGLKVTKKFYIEFPERYKSKELFKVTANGTQVVSTFAIVNGEDYGVMVGCANITLGNEYSMSIVNRDGEKYIQLHFEKDSMFIETLESIVTGAVLYPILDINIFRGKYGWYMEPEDALRIAEDSMKYTGIRAPTEAIQMVITQGIRVKGSLDKLWRTHPDKKHAFVPLADVDFGAGDNYLKIMGSYQKKGAVGALISRPKGVGPVEAVMRDIG